MAALTAWVPALIAACALSIAVFLAIRVARRGGASSASGHPPTTAPPLAIDWGAIDSYVELSKTAAAAAENIDEDGFLSGPFQRFLELGADPAQAPRARARMLEFGRATLRDFCERKADGDAIEARAIAIATVWFADKPNGDYMLEVLEGISNHNFRCERPKRSPS